MNFCHFVASLDFNSESYILNSNFQNQNFPEKTIVWNNESNLIASSDPPIITLNACYSRAILSNPTLLRFFKRPSNKTERSRS